MFTRRAAGSPLWNGGTTRSLLSPKGSHSSAPGSSGSPSTCVTKPMVDGHGQVGNNNPSGYECYVDDLRFCRGCGTRKGVVEVGLSHHWGGSLVWYCQCAWLWYLQCYVTHQGENQELERSQVLVKAGSYCVIQNRIFVSLREVSLDVSTGARGRRPCSRVWGRGLHPQLPELHGVLSRRERKGGYPQRKPETGCWNRSSGLSCGCRCMLAK